MGGYLGVQQGSQFPPQFIHMTYKPKKPSANVVKVALIGKGLTFDRLLVYSKVILISLRSW